MPKPGEIALRIYQAEPGNVAYCPLRGLAGQEIH